MFAIEEKNISKKTKIFYFETNSSTTGIYLKTTEVMINVFSVFYRKALKTKEWDGVLKIRLAFGRRKSRAESVTKEDLEERTDDHIFSPSVPHSPAAKTSAQEKRRESNVDPLNLGVFFQRIYEDNNADNEFYHRMTV